MYMTWCKYYAYMYIRTCTCISGVAQLVSRSEFPCSRGGAVLGDHSCPENSQCLYWAEGPNYGFTSFDNFRKGLLTVFQLTTLEGWSEVFYLVS